MSSREQRDDPNAVSPDASDDSLRRLYQRALTEETSGATHPDESAWERVFSGDATSDDRRRLMEHVVSCAQCADIYRGLTIVHREAAGFDRGAPASGPAAGFWQARLGVSPPSMRGMAFAAAAAVLLLAVIVPVAWRAWPAAPAPPTAGPPSSSAPAPARALRDHPAFRLDKPAVILSAAAALTPRSAGGDQAAFLAAIGPGLDAYRAGDFTQAALLLDQLSQTYPLTVEPPLYAGISLLMLNRPAEAVPRLARARTLAQGEFVAEADWRLSLAYVHAGDPERARPILQALCAAANPYQARACEALTAIDSGR